MLEQQRAHIIIPMELISEIDAVVGKRGRSRFMAEAARKELKRLHLEQALNRATGVWKDKDHPELENGAAGWVSQLRNTETNRFKSDKTDKRR